MIISSSCQGTPVDMHAVIVSVLGRDEGINVKAALADAY